MSAQFDYANSTIRASLEVFDDNMVEFVVEWPEHGQNVYYAGKFHPKSRRFIMNGDPQTSINPDIRKAFVCLKTKVIDKVRKETKTVIEKTAVTHQGRWAL